MRGVSRRSPAFERTLVAAFAFAYLYLVLFRDGTLIYLFVRADGALDEAARILDGQVMYRDFFEFLAPGTAHLDAAIMLLFGRDVAVLGWAWLLMGVVLALVLHSLAARLAGPGWRLLPSALFVVLVYAPYQFGNHKWPALLAGLAGLFRLLTGPLGHASAAIAGALFGLSSLFTQDLGLGLGVGVAAWVSFSQANARLAFLAALGLGYVAPIAIVMGFFAAKAGLATVVYDCLVFPLTEYVRANGFFVDLWSNPGPRSVACLTIALAGALAGVGLVCSTRLGSLEAERRTAERLVAFAGLGMLVATGVRGLYPLGLAVRASVLLLSLILILERLACCRGAAARRVARGLLAVLLLGLVHGALGLVISRQMLRTMTLQGTRAGAVWLLEPMPELAWIESQTAPGDDIFAFPAGAGLFFLTRTRNATSFPYMLEWQYSVAQQWQALSEIERARPEVGIWHPDQRYSPRSGASSLDVLEAGLFRSYEPAGRLAGNVMPLRRRRD